MGKILLNARFLRRKRLQEKRVLNRALPPFTWGGGYAYHFYVIFILFYIIGSFDDHWRRGRSVLIDCGACFCGGTFGEPRGRYLGFKATILLWFSLGLMRSWFMIEFMNFRRMIFTCNWCFESLAFVLDSYLSPFPFPLPSPFLYKINH